MITLNRVGDYISGSLNGIQFGVSFDEKKWELMQGLKKKADIADTMDELLSIVEEFKPLTEESYKELVEHTKGGQYLYVNKSTNKFYLKYQDKISSKPLPKVFVDKIVTSVEKNIDIVPLVKCMARYMRPVEGRPAYTEARAALFAQYVDADYVNDELVAKFQKDGLAPEVAKSMGTTKQVAITMEGLLAGFKVSTEIEHRFELDEETEEVKVKSRFGKDVDPDTGEVTLKKPEYVEERLFQPAVMGQGGDAFYCVPFGTVPGPNDKPGHKIKVGHVHSLDSWSKVSTPGSKGLHVGGLRYIQGYQSYPGAVTHEIFIDPMHIHTIAGLGNGNDGAMTVKQYATYRSFAGANKNIYHSSKYAALTDAEFAALVEEAVKATEAKAEELKAILDETRDLIDVAPATVTDVFGS